MKNILFFMVISISLSFFAYAENINECKTDIYYGNGVWNEYEDADGSRSELESLIKDEVIKGNTFLQAKYGKTKLAYNWGQGTLLDVLETYYQLKQAGQMEGIGFYTAIAALTLKLPHITLGAIATQKLMEPFTKDWEQGNVDEMWEKYENKSFKLGHRVMLVSHSQGNLFANRIHDKITPNQYQDYFANFQVASPANEVRATKGGYVTLYGDPVINPIPGSMGGNANGSPGHAFVEAYLAQSDPYNKIVAGMKQLLPTLDSEISQWETDQELDRNTCDYKITVKHRFDPSIEMGEKVYPFNGSKKLYQAKNKAGAYEYVKASCGGENILSTWDGKEDNECLMIDNPQEEKIEGHGRFIRDDDKEVVLDTDTSLMWQDSILVSKQWILTENYYAGDYFNTSGDTATTYCENLALGGYDDWRLPSMEELRRVGDPWSYEQIHNSFEHFASNSYWSSTTYYACSLVPCAYVVHFSYGSLSIYNKTFSTYVRCVRAGQ